MVDGQEDRERYKKAGGMSIAQQEELLTLPDLKRGAWSGWTKDAYCLPAGRPLTLGARCDIALAACAWQIETRS